MRERESVPFTLAWAPSHEPPPPAIDPSWALATTDAWWREWSGRCAYAGEWRDEVVRSLITLKALTYDPTGAIVAAPTTSLPELIGGERNWDYRYCWLRDSALTLEALMLGGYEEEAQAFRGWLRRATAGLPAQARIMYGIGGERLLPELELDWLPGYEDSKPVRVGNAASDQFQLDVFGELMHAARPLREGKLEIDPEPIWTRAKVVLGFLETAWKEPDDGIWEVRGGRQHFTHSKVMAWVAFKRAVEVVEGLGLKGPGDRWRAVRDEIHETVCREGFDADRNTFTQYFGSAGLDAAVLMIPAVGFLPGDDPRMVGTVEAIRDELMQDGFVYRYSTDGGVDGLEGGEGAFLPCSFWFVDALTAQGRLDEAREMLERLLAVSNEVGLLAEEYDPGDARQVGNFPQAFSHLALVSTAARLSRAASAV